jgi:hypothetical protein
MVDTPLTPEEQRIIDKSMTDEPLSEGELATLDAIFSRNLPMGF